jgi:hypothetical protein
LERDATRAFDVSCEPLGMSDVPMRTAFLIRDGETIEAAWMLGSELPDIERRDRGYKPPTRLAWKPPREVTATEPPRDHPSSQ